jgi:hypothetical protein
MIQAVMARLLLILLLVPLTTFADDSCDPDLKFLAFKTWIKNIQSETCASKEIALYPELEASKGNVDIVAATNAFHASLQAFFVVLEGDEFNGSMKDKIEANSKTLGKDAPVSKFKPIIFTLPVPGGRPGTGPKGVVKVGKFTVGNYRDYIALCTDDHAQPLCQSWIKTVRLLGAMNYLTAEFRKVWNENVLVNFDKPLQRYENTWDDYYEQRKPQMPWEMAVNQIAHRDIRTAGYFAMPPDGDWIVMHPALVYSSISAADAGDEKAIALAIELVGYNWWDKRVLSGLSVVAVTSDREGIEDLGYGLMLHFGSRYSFGWSRYDDDDGWFVSMDLLGVAVDKQKEVKLWTEDFKESEEALKGFKFE